MSRTGWIMKLKLRGMLKFSTHPSRTEILSRLGGCPSCLQFMTW